MASVQCDGPTPETRRPTSVRNRNRPVSAKVIISGGFGAGKTSFVTAVSEIKPVRSEAAMTDRGEMVDDRSLLDAKTMTTVAMDFGKMTADEGLVLYLFGTPGQDRFGFMWDDVTRGALGALVLADSRRLDDCYPAVDYFEARKVPFIVALNQFEGAPVHDRDEIRDAIVLNPKTPIVTTDARSPRSARFALVALLEHLLRIKATRGRVAAKAAPLPAGPPRPPKGDISNAFRMPNRPAIARAERPKPEPRNLSSSDAQRTLGIIGRVHYRDDIYTESTPAFGSSLS